VKISASTFWRRSGQSSSGPAVAANSSSSAATMRRYRPYPRNSPTASPTSTRTPMKANTGPNASTSSPHGMILVFQLRLSPSARRMLATTMARTRRQRPSRGPS
jgi:hypothetical protein